MKVTVRLFAILRERAGMNLLEVELDEGATVADLLEELAARPELGDLLTRMPVRMAVNRDYAEPGTALAPGDELALVPPVSGGSSGGVHVRITEDPLSVDKLSRLVSRPSAGAIVTFQGQTRDVDRLDYESYREMAEHRIEGILMECIERHGLAAAAAEHRVGPVLLGESSVIVAVSAAHRAEAFAGARDAIDQIKAEAPIWKREVEETGDGERARWVRGVAPTGRTSGNGPAP